MKTYVLADWNGDIHRVICIEEPLTPEQVAEAKELATFYNQRFLETESVNLTGLADVLKEIKEANGDDLSKEEFSAMVAGVEKKLRAKRFPSKKVHALTGTVKDRTGYSLMDTGTTIADAKELIRIGVLDPKEQQNESPTTQQLIDILGKYGDKVRLIGFVIYPPRDDARLSIDGFKLTGVTKGQLTAIKRCLKNKPDEYFDKHVGGGYYKACFWWD